jgi:hypothetical protein
MGRCEDGWMQWWVQNKKGSQRRGKGGLKCLVGGESRKRVGMQPTTDGPVSGPDASTYSSESTRKT